MTEKKNSALASTLIEHRDALLNGWIDNISKRMVRRDASIENEIRQQAQRLISLLAKALDNEQTADINTPAWMEVREVLREISETRARQGFSSVDTAMFVYALKEPLFGYLRTSMAAAPAALADEILITSTLFDQLGLFTVEAFQQSRERVILAQQQELLELSTPVVRLWKNVLALPLIGTLDSARTQIVMESLLQKIVETGASIAIIDITGVPTVDTLVAQHLLKTVAAARLMGADCIISGIRPQIAQTIVHLGVHLEDVITKATLADAFVVALERTGSTITHSHNDK
ncbi:MAG: anti-anti-sigma factor [Noviherbaspirillum sp.]|nr:anti-anti-sigma factor [Noviherbaspirillum sp.]